MMQGSYILYLIVFLFSFSSQAQNRIEFGVKGGYTLSAIRSTDRESNSIDYSGFTLGGYTKIPITEHLSFQPEILFTLRGDVYTEEDAFPFVLLGSNILKDSPSLYYAEWEMKSNLMTIALPLNINISVAKGFGLILGGEPSFVVRETRRDKFTGQINKSNTRTVSEHKRFDVGLNIGIYKSWEKLNFEIRYTQGLYDIYNRGTKKFLYVHEAAPYRNSCLQFTIGYQIYKVSTHYD